VAQFEGEGKQPQTAVAASRSRKKSSHETPKEASVPKSLRKIPRGLESLPIDGEAFVDAVHAKVDLVRLEVELLQSEDEKIRQRELAYLRELRYGKRASVADDEPTTFIFDAPRPERDLP
jgi:hypothetical protein